MDTVRGGEVWRAEAPGAQRLVSAGEWLVVHAAGPRVVGYDRDGTELFDRPGEAVRVNAGNLLLFRPGLESAPANLSVAGYAFEARERDRFQELGPLPGVTGIRCAWDERYLACPGENGLGIWRYAG